MPLREIDVKFTKSEVTLMAWRSQETSAQLEKRAKRPEKKNALRDGPVTTEDALKMFQNIGIVHGGHGQG